MFLMLSGGMDLNRVILHADANAFYASVECLYNPEIRSDPVAVAGDVENRHGIILAKNEQAKRRGVRTGDAIWQAREKCPGLVCLAPDYPLYMRFSRDMRRIFSDYSDRIESFGLDECWIDLTGKGVDMAAGERAANEIRLRVKRELGITISVGVSFNKIFAKLGSDLKKPDAVTVIPQERYRDIVWNLPAFELLYVGSATRRKLEKLNVRSIGDLARCDTRALRWSLGKVGLMLKAFANGGDVTPVMPADASAAIKSVGNSTTPPHDIRTREDAKCIYFVLAQSVAARLREQGLKARRVGISARTTDLLMTTRQCTLARPTQITDEILRAAMGLFEANYDAHYPYRSVGLSCSLLTAADTPVQLDLLGEEERRLKAEKLEHALDGLRDRYGHQIVRRGIELADERYAQVNPREEHLIHPGQFYTG